jgi:hypothetical protein
MLLDATGENPIGREYEQCFSDVFNEWFGPYICLAKRQGWAKGHPDGSFHPADSVSRAEGVTLASRLFLSTENIDSKGTFRDVPSDAWFAAPVEAMSKDGLLPFQGRLFSPGRAITRGETAEMLYRVMKIQEEEDEKAEEPVQGVERKL